jgi:4-hydroxybenzoate polyprenyltransferase
MGRWLIYVQERFPLLQQGILILGLSLIAKNSVVAFFGLFLFFFLLRAMDEYKDYAKDCMAHPERPLPRGLISKSEMKRLISLLLVGMVLFSFMGGIPYLVTTLYLFLMFHEFKIKRLAEWPILYAISHQLIIFPLAWFLTGELSLHTFQVGLTLFGGFFSYEICRKLSPKAHPLLKTYPQIYGPMRTSLFAALAAVLIVIGTPLLFPCALLLFIALAMYVKKPATYRVAETVSVVNLLACIGYLCIF